MLLKIESMNGKAAVELDAGSDEDRDELEGDQLPDCWLEITREDIGNSTPTISLGTALNPYEAEAVGNALLRWVKDVSLETDEDLDDDEMDDEDDEDDESELNR